MVITLFALLAIVLYLTAAAGLARPLLSGGQPLNRSALALAGTAVVIHTGILLGIHRGALDLHFFAAISLVACVVSALTLEFERTQEKLDRRPIPGDTPYDRMLYVLSRVTRTMPSDVESKISASRLRWSSTSWLNRGSPATSSLATGRRSCQSGR
jgi:membrane protein implicated in regulation of membrane protease activity